MSLKHMILGCLLDAPTHGYEIKQRFKNFYQRSHGINEGQLYTILKKMEDDGLVRKEIVYQEKNPPRKVFYLTGRGKEEFYSWLMEDAPPGDLASFDFFQVFPFLEKCNYFMHIPAGAALDLVERQIAAEKAKLEEFKRVKGKMLDRRVNHFRISIMEFGIKFQETKLDWLRNLRQKVLPTKGSDRYGLGPGSNK
ncbi:MAG: helix-turn-helix transcriptional regulator [Bacillota bacterium]